MFDITDFELVNVDGSAISTGLTITSTTANSVAGANVSGAVGSATTAGTVTTAAQPNITSVGTLTFFCPTYSPVASFRPLV